jgi:hypothetical protein
MKQSQFWNANARATTISLTALIALVTSFILGSGLAPPVNKIQEPNIGGSHPGT